MGVWNGNENLLMDICGCEVNSDKEKGKGWFMYYMKLVAGK